MEVFDPYSELDQVKFHLDSYVIISGVFVKFRLYYDLVFGRM